MFFLESSGGDTLDIYTDWVLGKTVLYVGAGPSAALRACAWRACVGWRRGRAQVGWVFPYIFLCYFSCVYSPRVRGGDLWWGVVMAYRKSMSRGSSQKVWKRNAGKVHKKNKRKSRRRGGELA